MKIDRDTYKIDIKNRYKSTPEKTQIVIAFSLRKEDYHVTHLKHKEYGNTKKWNTFTIGRDGTIYEHYHPKHYTDFLGLKDADKRSISIVIENMGSLLKTPENKYVNWLHEICPIEKVVEKKWLGHQYWEDIYPEQIESTLNLCKKLCIDFDINLKMIEFHYQHDQIMNYNGIVLKSNYFEDSSSVNPCFNLTKFNDLLQLNE